MYILSNDEGDICYVNHKEQYDILNSYGEKVKSVTGETILRNVRKDVNSDTKVRYDNMLDLTSFRNVRWMRRGSVISYDGMVSGEMNNSLVSGCNVTGNAKQRRFILYVNNHVLNLGVRLTKARNGNYAGKDVAVVEFYNRQYGVPISIKGGISLSFSVTTFDGIHYLISAESCRKVFPIFRYILRGGRVEAQ